jgi:hypothetical protein
MKTTIMAGALAALVLMPASASAHTRTKPLKGTFQLVSADAVYTDGNFGKAQLVDGKRNDRLSVHLRHGHHVAQIMTRSFSVEQLQQLRALCQNLTESVSR